MLGNGGGALRRAPDLLHVRPNVGRNFPAAQEEVGEPQHHGHLVVGFVGHAAGEAAQGLHPLDLPQMLLGAAPVGYVGGHAHDPERLVRVAQGPHRQIEPQGAAVGTA